MKTLLFVGVLSREQHPEDKDHINAEDCNLIDGVVPGVIDAERKDAPPVKGLEDPEEDHSGDYSNPVAAVVRVDSLVISFINSVVSRSVSCFVGGDS